MKRCTTILLTIALALPLLPGQDAIATTKATPLTLVYGNDVRGELAPCG